MESFYLLRLDVDGGGARKDMAYVCSTVEEVQVALLEELELDPTLQLCYGQRVALSLYAGREEKATIWLGSFITARIEGFTPMRFDDYGEPVGFDPRRDAQGRHLYKSNGVDAATCLCLQINEALGKGDQDTLRVHWSVDWERAAIPSLPEPILPAGTTVFVPEIDEEHRLAYGPNDLEDGDPDERPPLEAGDED